MGEVNRWTLMSTQAGSAVGINLLKLTLMALGRANCVQALPGQSQGIEFHRAMHIGHISRTQKT